MNEVGFLKAPSPREMALWVKCLPGKHESLRPSPGTHTKSQFHRHS